MIKVYKVTHRSDISSFPCDWSSVLNFYTHCKSKFDLSSGERSMTALCRQLFKSNVYQRLLMHTNFVKSLIFCYKDNQKVEHYIAGTESNVYCLQIYYLSVYLDLCQRYVRYLM